MAMLVGITRGYIYIPIVYPFELLKFPLYPHSYEFHLHEIPKFMSLITIFIS